MRAGRERKSSFAEETERQRQYVAVRRVRNAGSVQETETHGRVGLGGESEGLTLRERSTGQMHDGETESVNLRKKQRECCAGERVWEERETDVER